MAIIIRFEEIEGWKQSRELALAVYQTTASTAFVKDLSLCDQMRRAAVSIMANIAEGFGRGGNKEFVQFLGHSPGSCAELKSHFYVALDTGMLARQQFEHLYRLAGATEGLISGFMKYLQNSTSRGRKFVKANNREP